LPRFDDQLELLRIDTLASLGRLTTYELVKSRMAALPPGAVRPPRLLTGDELLALGFEAGPRMGQILAALEHAQLEGELSSKEEAAAFVLNRFEVKPPSTA